MHRTEAQNIFWYGEVKDIVTSRYLWCKARCCSDHSSSFWQETGRGAWPPCECPHTSRRCREPGWRGPEPEWSRSGRVGSESDVINAPAWPHRGKRRQGRLERGEKVRQRGGGRGTLHLEIRQHGTVGLTKVPDGAGRVGQMLWAGFKRWWAARFKWKTKINVM